MIEKPLSVYLDSKDFLNFFSAQRRGQPSPVLESLLAARDRDEIRIGFSAVTIAEVITKPDTAHREDRYQKAELIRDICQNCAFPPLPDLIKGASFPNGGSWMAGAGDKIAKATTIRATMRQAFHTEIDRATNLNRQQKRQLKRSASFHEVARRIGSSWGQKREDWAPLPVSDKFLASRIFQRFMTGRCSDAEFEQEINAWINDPAEFARIWYDYGNRPDLREALFDSSQSHFGTITDQLRCISELEHAASQDATAALRSLIAAGVPANEARAKIKAIGPTKIDRTQLFQPIANHVGPKLSQHFEHYFARALKPGFQSKPSDMRDLLQLCYAYDCDLFSCDRHMQAIFADFPPFHGTLVGKIDTLPRRITELVARKS